MFRARLLASVAVFFFLSAAYSWAAPEKGNAFVDEVWKAWNENNRQQIEAKFTASLKEDPANTSAALWLCLLYHMQNKDREAWSALKNIFQAKEKAYPYAYALWVSLNDHFDDPQSGALALSVGRARFS